MDAKNISKLHYANNVIISGIVGSDDSIYRNKKGNYCSFSFAQYVGKDDKGNKQTVWHKVKAFGNGNNPVDLDLIRKGEKLVIKGRFAAESYTTKEGKAVTDAVILASEIEVNVPIEYAPVDAE